jgi:Xrn1 helical domain
VGYALLLQRSGVLGMVLRLSLCTSHFRYGFFYIIWIVGIDISCILVDLRKVNEMASDFQLGIPFRPYEQLMGVLPVASMNISH